MTTLYLRRTTGAEQNFRPGFPSGRASRRDAITLPSDPIIRQRRQRNERDLLVWDFRWKETREGQVFILERAWALAAGPVLTMLYTEPGDIDANAFTVAFVENSLEIERVGPVTYNMAVAVEEVD